MSITIIVIYWNCSNILHYIGNTSHIINFIIIIKGSDYEESSWQPKLRPAQGQQVPYQ